MTEILKLKKSNCKNCHKCIRECPVKSISFAENQAKVVSQECILCGRCTLICPQNAKQVRSDLTEVLAAIGSGRRAIATVAPSFISEFCTGGLEPLTKALQSLGFAEVRETAEGAHVVKTEYERLISEGKHEVLISTCCHTVVSLVQKYYPDMVGCLAPVISPMMASAKLIRQQNPDAYIVFIGPCISKKEEMEKLPGFVDCVLTFDELHGWFEQKGVRLETKPLENPDGRVSRFFPKTGGILQSMEKDAGWEYLAVDGVENCMAALEEIRGGRLHHCFIEMSSCTGSCINGPAAHGLANNVIRSHLQVDRFAQPDPSVRHDFVVTQQVPLARFLPVEPVHKTRHSEADIAGVLARMGKTRPDQELNCQGCGYPTCRDKAIAVLDGKADIAMCLPFLLERAESFSTNIFEISPNALLVLDESMDIQKINASARQLFGMDGNSNLEGIPLVELMDPSDFYEVLDSGNDLIDKKMFLPEHEKYIELSVVRDEEHHSLYAILKDVTQAQVQQERYRTYRDKTVEITDKVVEKQMRIVQEIASLLGETTAETKVALSQIKTTLLSEDPS